MNGVLDITDYWAQTAAQLFDVVANGRCVVLARLETKDTRGSVHPVWGEARTPYELPCTWDGRTGRTVNVGGKWQTVAVYQIALPAIYEGQPVVALPGDRLRVTAPALAQPLLLQIEPTALRGSGAQIELMCLEVQD
jgi:hypothetical protein